MCGEGWARRACIALFSVIVVVLAGTGRSFAQTITPTFASDYSFIDLGSVPGLPTPYGGLTLKWDDPNTLIIGGNANAPNGKLYSIGVVRDANLHITGFTGTAQLFADGAHIDGGLAYGPGNVLFLSRYPLAEIGQVKPGNSTTTDKVISLSALGVSGSPGGLNFVPAGFTTAGHLKIVAYNTGNWIDAMLVPDGNGTYNLVNVTTVAGSTLTAGPEGFVYVPPGSDQFPNPSILVSSYSAGQLDAYEVNSAGDPLPATRRPFMTGLSGAEGAFLDPLTGDYLFSTFGGTNHVIAVRGFAIPEPTSLTLVILPAAWVLSKRRRSAR